MAIDIHHSDSRGMAEHGWLSSRHTFSFANYYNPKRMGFGLLRVINDDVVQPGMGFGRHPHDNMEIISIPIMGSLKHKDSMGNEHVILASEVQVMSAGTGITHSEYNNSDSDMVNFLQIWVLPKEINIAPKYGQKMFPKEQRHNKFQLLVSPEPNSDGLWINQNAYFSMIDLDESKSISYETHSGENGVYVFIIAGSAQVLSSKLSQRDGIAITEERVISIQAIEDSQVLLMEVPMK
jgi:redox-sensitive bicupin YhaK (pirin superfamily)